MADLDPAGPDLLGSGIGALALVDHHVHPALEAETDAAEFEALLTESDRPLPPGLTQFDSQLGDGGPPLVRAGPGPRAVRVAR